MTPARWLTLAAFAALAALAGWQAVSLANERAGRSSDRAAFATEREQAATKALAQSEKNRALETHLESIKDGATHVLEQTRADLARRDAAHRADTDRVRDKLAARLAGPAPSGAATDSLAACRADAAAAGELLVEGVRLQGELAGAAEHHAAEVRALLGAWPLTKGGDHAADR